MTKRYQVNKPEKTLKGQGRYVQNVAKYNRYLVDFFISGNEEDKQGLMEARQEIINYLNYIRTLIEDEEIVKKLS